MQEIVYYSERSDLAVDWVFHIFSTFIGCAFRPACDRNDASLLYTDTPGEVQQLHIPIWPEYYESAAEHYIGSGGYWMPVHTQKNTEAEVDYIGLVFRLLTLTDELHIPSAERDPFGNIFTSKGFPRSTFRDCAMVDKAVQALKEALIRKGIIKERELLPRWPYGKQYAVLITHDTDGPCLLEAKELAKAGIKGILRADDSERQAFLEGCRRLITGGEDPYFNFAHWAVFEQTLEATSAFYLYIKSKDVPNHLNNPLYHLDSNKQKWQIMRQLADCGWEIGLHTSIHGLEADEYIQSEKRDLELFLGRPVTGSRSHYWNIDWRNPIASFRRLEAAGLTYDLSLAWKDSPGFRSGTTLPYHPYDKEHMNGLKLLVIPTSLMDGHLFEYRSDTNPQILFQRILQQVRTNNGILTLDWHTRTWCNKFMYEGWRDFIVQELTKLALTKEAWFTTPRTLSEYWLAREQQLHI